MRVWIWPYERIKEIESNDDNGHSISGWVWMPVFHQSVSYVVDEPINDVYTRWDIGLNQKWVIVYPENRCYGMNNIHLFAKIEIEGVAKGVMFIGCPKGELIVMSPCLEIVGLSDTQSRYVGVYIP